MIFEFKEDTLLKILHWYSPMLSATLATMNVAENLVFYGEKNFLFHFRYKIGNDHNNSFDPMSKFLDRKDPV